jgi:hypothetical protein
VAALVFVLRSLYAMRIPKEMGGGMPSTSHGERAAEAAGAHAEPATEPPLGVFPAEEWRT